MVTLIDTNATQTLRHPEKRNRPESGVLRKPEWLRV
jgi:lipoic acid synthetase